MDIREKMKRDWDRRAKVDPLYWVAATEEADEDSYHKSAEQDCSAFVEGLRERISSDARVLDVGCGIGRMTAPLGQHFAQVVGVDVSGEMIEHANTLHAGTSNVSFYVNNGSDLAQFPDNDFDLALSYSVLPHLPPEVVNAYFADLNRVLKPGAWFRYQFWIGPERMMAENDTLNIRVYSPEKFAVLNGENGFKVHEIDEIDYFDPVLKLRPVWVNAQKIGPTTSSVDGLDEQCDDGMSEDERHLETSLLLYLAAKHQDRAEINEAEAVLEQAIQSDPSRPDGYISWATIRIEKDDVKGALKIFETLTETIPEFAPGWVFRAQTEEACDRGDDALKSLVQAESLGCDEELRSIVEEIRARLRP